MSIREREGLIARIRQVRRVSPEADEPARPATSGSGEDEPRALDARITRLEQVVEGFQDSVHRELMRLNKRVDELEVRIQPAELGRALSENARERGL